VRLTGSRLNHRSPTRAEPAIDARWASVLLLAAFVLIFTLDHATGAAPVQHLYYLPIAYAAIRFGTPAGIAAAATAIVLYHVANPHSLTFRYEESDVLQVAVFVAVGVVAATLASDARRLHRLAMTDDLTGLHNLRSFELRLKAMVRTARREGTPLSLLVLDVDRLKSINDVHGHLAGAEAVRTVGRLIAAVCSPSAAACRYGGDEFVIALPRSNAAGATEVAEELRRAVNSVAPVLAGISFPAGTLSISVGLASQRFERGHAPGVSMSDEEVGEALFRDADAALYVAKNGGRNRIRRA
jgi:diguanylate cyclase (GGDEF)-like protein